MAKIECLRQWNAHAALHSALEDTNPEDCVYILVRTPEDKVSAYYANYKNAYLYWDLAGALDDVMDVKRRDDK